MVDFLTFKTFITPTLLVTMYYFAAIVIPLVSYTLVKWIQSSYFNDINNEINKNISLQQYLLIVGKYKQK